MLNMVTQKKLFNPENKNYILALNLIQQIKEIKNKIADNVWEIAVILNKVWQEKIWQKAGFLSFYHFLAAAGLRPNAIMLSIAADVFTETEFRFIGESKARYAAAVIKAHPDKKDEIMALAQSSATLKEFRQAIEPFTPNSDQNKFISSYIIKGPKEQIDAIRHIVDLIITTGVVSPYPAEVIEFALTEFYNGIKTELQTIDVEALSEKVDEITGVQSR